MAENESTDERQGNFAAPDREVEQNQTPIVTQAPRSSNKGLSIVAYITWIGFIIALVAGDWHNDDTYRRNVNQALVLNLFALLSIIPIAGLVWGVIIFVLWIMAVIGACGSNGFRAVPILGGIEIIK